jgi:hypothetical protein
MVSRSLNVITMARFTEYGPHTSIGSCGNEDVTIGVLTSSTETISAITNASVPRTNVHTSTVRLERNRQSRCRVEGLSLAGNVEDNFKLHLGFQTRRQFAFDNRNMQPGSLVGLPMHWADAPGVWTLMGERFFTEQDGKVVFQGSDECLLALPRFEGSARDLSATASPRIQMQLVRAKSIASVNGEETYTRTPRSRRITAAGTGFVCGHT